MPPAETAQEANSSGPGGNLPLGWGQGARAGRGAPGLDDQGDVWGGSCPAEGREGQNSRKDSGAGNGSLVNTHSSGQKCQHMKVTHCDT